MAPELFMKSKSSQEGKVTAEVRPRLPLGLQPESLAVDGENIPPALALLAPPSDSCAPHDVGGSLPSLVVSPLDRSWSWSFVLRWTRRTTPPLRPVKQVCGLRGGGLRNPACIAFPFQRREKVVLPVEEGGNTP